MTLAKLYGKEAYKFMELQETKKFIALWDENSAPLLKEGFQDTTTSAFKALTGEQK